MAKPDGASILYSCVAKEGNIMLSECIVKPSANVAPMARGQLLPKITDGATLAQDRRASYTSGAFLVQIVFRSRLAFVCITDKDYAVYMAFKFLDKIAANFIAFYRDEAHRTPQACQTFTRQLKQESDFFNGPEANKLRKIQQDIDQVKSVMVENLDVVLQRGEKIESLMEKTNLLLGESTTFVSNSTSLRKKMWLKNVKLIAIIVFIVVAIITIIVLIACQGFKSGNRCS